MFINTTETIQDKTFDEERAFYDSHNLRIENCKFDGPKDGESAFKESRELFVKNCFFNLRYPFWHDNKLYVTQSELTTNCRAALWYTNEARIEKSKLHGIKALRECYRVCVDDCNVVSPEFGWNCNNIQMFNTLVESEYFMMHSKVLNFQEVVLNGKYSFQYVKNSVLMNCKLDTKDAFWHSKNVTVIDSDIKGEYLGWYSENLTLINCKIIGTQPLCYCKKLRLINCTMENCDLAFEKSDVKAQIVSFVDSIKNPKSGKIEVGSVGQIINDYNTKCKIIVNK